MAVYSIRQFLGIAPRVNPAKLGPGMAQLAQNVRLTSGALDAWRAPLVVLSGVDAATRTIYRFGQDLFSDTQYWFTWSDDVDVVKSAIADDQTERTFFTHPMLGPRQTNNSLALTGGAGSYPRASYPLGIPRPSAAPTTTVLAAGNPNSSMETVVHAYTYVSIWGEEGQPSAPSAALDLRVEGGTSSVTGLGSEAPTGYAGYITAKRIYRTISGNATTEFRLVDEIPISQSSYSDTKSMTVIAQSDLIASATYNPPPQGCFGITQMANGITLVFKGNDAYASEAYLPYAYPTAYRQTLEYAIVGAKAVGTSAVICTLGHPYLLTGSDPSAMSLVKLDSPQACLSKLSIAAVAGGVMYASPDGLVYITQTGDVQVLSAALFTREDWQALNPASMRGFFQDGRYFGSYLREGQRQGFIFDPAQGEGAFTTTTLVPEAGFADITQDALFFRIGTEILKWNAGTAKMTYIWRSNVVELSKPSNPACAQVVANGYPVVFKFYADGTLKHTQTVTDADPFWLPSGYRCRFYEVQIEGSEAILAVHVASSKQELKGV